VAGNPGFRARPGRPDDVKSLRRARAGLVGAVVLAIAIVAAGLPTGTIGRQRDALAAADRQLATVEAHNAVIRSEITSLRQRSTIEAIAREDYGLVRPGQRSFVILPGKGAHAVGAGTLGLEPIPADDLVPTSVSAVAPLAAAAGAKSASLWSRTLNELEFWRWAM
jgi:cell division protein FtsB